MQHIPIWDKGSNSVQRKKEIFTFRQSVHDELRSHYVHALDGKNHHPVLEIFKLLTAYFLSHNFFFNFRFEYCVIIMLPRCIKTCMLGNTRHIYNMAYSPRNFKTPGPLHQSTFWYSRSTSTSSLRKPLSHCTYNKSQLSLANAFLRLCNLCKSSNLLSTTHRYYLLRLRFS